MDFRNKLLTKNRVIFLDGIAGGGKILLAKLLTALPKVDQFIDNAYSEQICAITFLKKIKLSTAVHLIENNFNRVFYESIILRNVNFRKSDQTTILDHPRYGMIKNRLKSDDKKVFNKYKKKVIIHFYTHFISNYSEPIFKVFKNKLLFVRLFRSPLNIYMIRDLANWSIKWEKESSRDGCIRIYSQKHKKNFPFFVKDQLGEYFKSNKYERAILILELFIKNEIKLRKLKERYNSNVVNIPFENLILNPNFYLEKLSKKLFVKRDKLTSKVLKKNNVPRKFNLNKHDNDGLKFLKNKISNKYLDRVKKLNNFYHKNIIKKY